MHALVPGAAIGVVLDNASAAKGGPAGQEAGGDDGTPTLAPSDVAAHIARSPQTPDGRDPEKEGVLPAPAGGTGVAPATAGDVRVAVVPVPVAQDGGGRALPVAPLPVPVA